jgi:DHA1 family inner membrane transport protein
MAFFHNRNLNLLNLHYVIGSVAAGGGGAFYEVWLLKAGISVPGVLMTLAGIFATRLLMRMFMLPIAIRVGLRALVVAGALLMGVSFVVLAHVRSADGVLIAFAFAASLADTVYWPSYHAFFAALGDSDHRGQQLSIREGVTAAVGIVSPLVTAWLLINFGPVPAFYATGVVWAFAAIPLLWTPDVAVARSAPGAFRSAVSGVMLFVGDGWVSAGYFMVWQLTLFLSLGRDVMAYGGALAISALVGAISGLFLGRLIDSGRGSRAVSIAGGVLTLVILLRAAAGGHPLLAVLANALGAFVACLYVPTMMTAVYNQAKRSPCVMRFHIAAEGGWDIGVTTGLSLSALLVWLGITIAHTILLSLAGAAFTLALLRRYYAAHPSEFVDASQTQGEEAAKI